MTRERTMNSDESLHSIAVDVERIADAFERFVDLAETAAAGFTAVAAATVANDNEGGATPAPATVTP